MRVRARTVIQSRIAALFKAALTALVFMALASAARADAASPHYDGKILFPNVAGAIQFNPSDTLPSLAEVRANGVLVGYAFSTRAVIDSVGYSGKPLDIEVGLLLDGRISGARLVAHQEPILIIGISDADLRTFVGGLAGADVRQSASLREVSGRGGADHIAGATISSTVIRDAVFRSARRVAAATGLIQTRGEAGGRVNLSAFEPRSWDQLLSMGAIRRLTVTKGEAEARSGRLADEPSALFIDLYAALLTPAMIGQNLLGRQIYENLTADMPLGSHAILIAGNGLYSFKGAAYRQSGHFDRLQIVQGAHTIQLTSEGYRNLSSLAAAGAPEFREIGVFRIPAGVGFNAAKRWRLDLLTADPAGRAGGQSGRVALEYQLPESLILRAASPAAEQALWEQIWEQRRPEIALAVTMLLVLTTILLFQDALTSRVALYRATRLTFLAMTFVFLGLYAGAQLSIVNVVTFSQSLLHGFKWENFLLDPLIFLLWSFTAAALLFWGRGVFCGWLCPFGALQELLNEGARRLGVKQIQVPWQLHERLWLIKYVAFLLILAFSLNSAADAFRVAEIEPFKTAIALKFQRDLVFVAYALALLFASLFIERFYCRYLCPLGAGLAIPAKLKLFDWLNRRPQCGAECHICELRCTVQAIDPIGRINPNECIYCLNCQANYYDSNTCMVLIRRAARRQGGSAPGAGAFRGGSA